MITVTLTPLWYRQPAGLVVLALLLMVEMPTLAMGMTTVNEVIELDKPESTAEDGDVTSRVKLSKPIDTLASPLKNYVEDPNALSVEDTANLNILWGSVISHNPIIQFGLERVMAPPELRNQSRRKMTRLMSAVISGASLLPYAMGADQWSSGAALIGRNLAHNKVLKPEKLDDLPTDRELVELSGLVQDLQHQVIHEYFQYKQRMIHIQQLEEKRRWVKHQSIKAGQQQQGGEQLWLNHYEQQLQFQQHAMEDEAKSHLLMLQRLVGLDAIELLRFKTPEQGV